jgi:hypothetical protein
MTFPHLRRRRDDPLDVVQNIIKIGPRPATSLGEAQAAAYVDSRLRRSGLSVSADTFWAATSPGFTYPLLAVIGISAAVLALWMPLPALLLAVYGLALTISDALAAPLPAMAPRRDSQNIVATRPRADAEDPATPPPHWRVVLLAPLDTPIERLGVLAVGGRRPWALVGRVVAFGVLVVLLLLLLFDPRPMWAYALAAPALYLFIMLLLPGLGTNRDALPGGAGALAVLLAAAERLGTTHAVEVWAVALGATATGNCGLHNFLARYPFAKDRTLFLSLQHIHRDPLTYAPYEGMLHQYRADPLLVRLATLPDDADEPAAPVAGAYASASSIASVLHSRDYRAMTLRTRPLSARHTAAGSTPDAPVDRALLEQASRLIVQIVQRLDADEQAQEADHPPPAANAAPANDDRG